MGEVPLYGGVHHLSLLDLISGVISIIHPILIVQIYNPPHPKPDTTTQIRRRVSNLDSGEDIRDAFFHRPYSHLSDPQPPTPLTINLKSGTATCIQSRFWGRFQGCCSSSWASSSSGHSPHPNDSHYQSALNAVYKDAVQWSEFPIVHSFPRYPPSGDFPLLRVTPPP